MSDFKAELLNKINIIRSNPKNNFVGTPKSKDSSKSRNYNFTKVKPSKDLILSELLCKAADEYIAISNAKYAFEEEALNNHLSHYIRDFHYCSMLVSNENDIDEIINNLLIQEKSKQLVSNSYKNIGISKGCSTVIIITDEYSNLSQLGFTDSLIVKINQLRQNPKSFLKYVNEYVSNKNKSLKLSNFLNKLRSFESLTYDNYLEKAAKEFNLKLKMNNFQIKTHVSMYVSGFNHIGYIKKMGYENPIEYILDEINEELMKSYLFSKIFKFFGVSYFENSQTFVIIFADHIQHTRENIIKPEIPRKLHRPNLTQDEIQQIKFDYEKMDILNKGYITPNIILQFTTKEFTYTNPIYYSCIKKLDTSENNRLGVNFENFLEAVKTELKNIDYSNFYDLLSMSRKYIDFKNFKSNLENLNYSLDNDKIKDVIENVTEGDSVINSSNFGSIMKIVDNMI